MTHSHSHDKEKTRQFSRDFAPLEKILKQTRAGRQIVSVEMMIVELNLTPRTIAQIEQRYGMKLHWFKPSYQAMKRHYLLPKSRDWDAWLHRYRRKRRTLGLQ